MSWWSDTDPRTVLLNPTAWEIAVFNPGDSSVEVRVHYAVVDPFPEGGWVFTKHASTGDLGPQDPWPEGWVWILIPGQVGALP